MLVNFVGGLIKSAELGVRQELPEKISVTEFDGGFLANSPNVSVHRNGGDICIACGEPQFQDSNFNVVARRDGLAAAWFAAFEALGKKAPEKVHGRFSTVFINPNERSAIILTDRFATWPICYAESDGNFYFSDRADFVVGRGNNISAQSIYDYLFFHVLPAPSTIFEGVKRLLPGQILSFIDGEVNQTCYWRPSFRSVAKPALVEDEKEFLNLLEAGVTNEVSDRRVGAFLSGGTDSSTVVGMLSRVLDEQPNTYSIGFDATGYDEMEYARLASRHFGTNHHEYYVTPDDLVRCIPAVSASFEQPFGNSSLVPTLICAERAKEDGVEKLLAGDGGDELFAGNTRYAKERIFGWYGAFPRVLRQLALEPFFGMSSVGRIPLLKKGSSYIEQARVPLPDRLEMYNMLLRLGDKSVLEKKFLSNVSIERPFDAQREFWESIDAETAIDRLLAFDWKYTLADNDLPKVLGAAKLAGIEIGFPLLSHELLEFSMRLSPGRKLRGLKLRWFFKYALREFLPVEILSKKKHGFGLPFGVWACENPALMKLARDAVYGLLDRGLVQETFIAKLFADDLPSYPNYYGEMVWILMTLELWLQNHAPDWQVNIDGTKYFDND